MALQGLAFALPLSPPSAAQSRAARSLAAAQPDACSPTCSRNADGAQQASASVAGGPATSAAVLVCAAVCSNSRGRRSRRAVARGAAAQFTSGLSQLQGNVIGSSGALHLEFSAKCLPHPEKVAKGGEDGYYACPASQSFGLADGVGGWASQGVDPGEFSRNVLETAYTNIRSASSPSSEVPDLKGALLKAVDGVFERKLEGGTTVLLGQLHGSLLSVLNFGDSGLMVLRPALRQRQADRPVFMPRIVFRTNDQTHYFNCPYQVSSHSAVMEPPDLVHVSVEAGDLIVAGTDGVFDNLFDHEIQGLASQCLGRVWLEGGDEMGPLLETFAAQVAEEAQSNGRRTDGAQVPFGVSAAREGMRFNGGKLDDTTVVVAMVMPAPEGGSGAEPGLINNFMKQE